MALETLKIALVGDVMCGDSFYALGHGVASMLDRQGESFLDAAVTNFLGEHDLVLFNMESVLSDHGRRDNSLRRLHMRGRPQHAVYLARWGFTCANVANNHILEQGHECAVDTVRNLSEVGIRAVGAGTDSGFADGLSVIDFDVKGHRLSVLGHCALDEKYAYAGGARFEEVLAAVTERCEAGRTVVVSMHWGQEFMDRPNASQKEMAAQLLAAGACVIAGHHPHVVQGLEAGQGTLVAYSLGNFIFDHCMDDCRWSMIVTVELGESGVRKWQTRPVVLDTRHSPAFVSGSENVRLLAEIERRNRLIGVSEEPQAYEAQFQQANEAFRRALRRTLLGTWTKKKIVFWPQLLARPLVRRLGKW